MRFIMPEKQLNGAEVLIKCLEDEGVEYIFGYVGGVVIPIFDALLNSSIKLIMTRHEQNATHIADGYARVTGKPGVVLVTSGPGASNTVTGIMNAHMDSVPMIVLTGQVATSLLGKDAFQEADAYGITMPIVKHSYLAKDTNILPKLVKEAFHITQTGRPGPVLIDLPANISKNPFTGNLQQEMDIPGYQPVPEPLKEDILTLADYINNSKKPLILVGHGAVISKAGTVIKEFAEKINAPVTNTLLGKGAFSEFHDLSLGMLGMHGTAYANIALTECDLILSIGSRWDDRINGDNRNFAKNAIKLHIDIDEAEIGKIVKPDAHCIGDARIVMEQLLKHVHRLDTKSWLKRISSLKRQYPLKYTKQKGLKPQQIIDAVCKYTQGKAIVTTDVGQHQMWSSQFYKVEDIDTWVSSGGLGTMGFGLPSAIGAQFGQPDKTVVSFIGDGGFQMTMSELATAALHKLPIKFFVLENKYLGMVRQWQDLFYDNRLSGVDLEGNPDFIKIAEAYGIKGFRLKRSADINKIIKKAFEYTEGPCLIHASITKEDNVFPMIPAGKSAEYMIIEKKSGK
jgi:acetolactate synthase-1/2/3 large subunit